MGFCLFLLCYWHIVPLRCFVGFCCTIKWTSDVFTYKPAFLSLPPCPHPSYLGHHRPRAELPTLHSRVPAATCPTHGNVYVWSQSPNSSRPPNPFMATGPPSMSVSLFLPCKEVHLYHFSIVHIYALIHYFYFSLSYFTLCDTPGPSASLQMTLNHFFLWLDSIPLYVCIIPFLTWMEF